MKKFFVLLAFCGSVFAANAQREVGTLTLQPKVGVTMATLSDFSLPLDDIGEKLDSKMLFGGMAGVEAEYQLTPMISLSAGINYVMQGTQLEDYEARAGAVYAGVKDIKIEMNYFNVPITANFYVYKGLALRAGVQFGIVSDAKMKFTAYGNTTVAPFDGETEFEEDIKDTKMDISIPLGISYEYDDFVIDARYNLGLSKIADDCDSKNRVIQLSLGYKFDL